MKSSTTTTEVLVPAGTKQICKSTLTAFDAPPPEQKGSGRMRPTEGGGYVIDTQGLPEGARETFQTIALWTT